MTTDTDRLKIEDLGRKLDHAEGLMGAYLPSRVFDSGFHKKILDCTKFSLSRLRNGRRPAYYWELGRFADLFELGRYGLDYEVFLLPFEQYCDALKAAGVGSHGGTASERLRETLRSEIAPDARIAIRLERTLSVGGIGALDEEDGLVRLTPRDRVTLSVPLAPEAEAGANLLLLHDFPGERAMSTLMPSLFAPDPLRPGRSLRLPQSGSGYESFPVGGKPGYRCLYAIQSDLDLAGLLNLDDPDGSVPELGFGEMALLMDALKGLTDSGGVKARVLFGEYILA